MNRAATLLLLSLLPCSAVAVTDTLPAAPALSAAQPAAAQSTVAVLGYGRLVKKGDGSKLTIAEFARQMAFLAEQGMPVISLKAFLAWRRGEISLPARTCILLTFDEADAVTCAAVRAVLPQYRFPCVVFADEKDFEGKRLPALQALQQAGTEVGSHTLTRPQSHDWQFAALSGAEEIDRMCHRELGLSAELVRRHCGDCTALSYPRGYTDASIINSMSLYGYEAAFCAQEGKVSRRSPAYRLHRYMVQDDEAFVRAVNFGKDSDAAPLLSLLTAAPLETPALPEEPAAEPVAATPNPAPAAAPQPATPSTAPVDMPVAWDESSKAAVAGVTFDDDEVAEEVDDEETATAALPTVPMQNVKPDAPAGKLVRRTPDADWVTANFAAPLVPRDQTRVAVLGYHNFSNTKTVTEMRMRTSEFCVQMQYIHDAGLSVITMQDFLEWLHGERCLPERCVLITLDDGWKSVYTDAYPVMKAYGYPFTLFLYTTYVQVQGDSMTRAQIKEMMDNGATVGSHSAHHYYPRMWKRYSQQSEKYTAQVQTELPDSAATLKQWFGNCSTYCYPGGYNTPPMLESLAASDYKAAFTVIPAKVSIQENPFLVHRYMVFGTDASIFRHAVNFDGDSGAQATKEGIEAAKAPARAFFPKAFE